MVTHEYGDGFTERALRERTLSEREIEWARKRRINLTDDQFVFQHGGRIFSIQTEFTQSFQTMRWQWSWDLSELLPRGSRTWRHDGFQSTAPTRSAAVAEAVAYIADHIIGNPDVPSEE